MIGHLFIAKAHLKVVQDLSTGEYRLILLRADHTASATFEREFGPTLHVVQFKISANWFCFVLQLRPNSLMHWPMRLGQKHGTMLPNLSRSKNTASVSRNSRLELICWRP